MSIQKDKNVGPAAPCWPPRPTAGVRTGRIVAAAAPPLELHDGAGPSLAGALTAATLTIRNTDTRTPHRRPGTSALTYVLHSALPPKTPPGAIADQSDVGRR